ncbi:hypothetical protein ACQ4M4_16920 [Leptolyngbya sp. AN02str]|uniref:hypothetical protein n=1 Tax=Leptolyngbya sp. AN02str TaxID=3423363 RepID=UPI003D3243F4
MDDWQGEWERMFETFARDVEQFFEDVAKGVNDAADAVAEFTEEAFERFEQAIAPSLDDFEQEVEGFVDPVIQLISTVEASIMQAMEPVSHTVDPIVNEHPACVGCQNYHGHSYNGEMLVCAMHPHGWTADNDCPDYDGPWRKH